MTGLQQHTIDVGIDLGTTNSSIAVLVDGEPIVLSGMNSPTTPSVVRVRTNGALDVGLVAYQQLEFNPDDVKSEFKTSMGTQQRHLFASSGRQMTSTELSAEVLKVLLGYVGQRFGFAPSAAVITVPAAFDLAQCAATQQAAESAGLRQAPLLQEPVAAALAYGYSVAREQGTWLVYDLGGGTFDLALVGIRDGQISVLDHEGDNHLGGKDIDWLIVEQILVPKLAKHWQVSSFRRGNPARRPQLAVLKAAAETAKIALSVSLSATVTLESGRVLLTDDAGAEIEAEVDVSRQELEAITLPLVNRTIELTRRLIARNHQAPPTEVMLVGGPTLMPLVRERLRDEVGLTLNTRANPLTAVAEGAALYAGAQLLQEAGRARLAQASPADATSHTVTLQHVAVTEDSEAAVGFRSAITDAAVLLVTSAGWESGQVPLASGACFLRVPLLTPGRNEFTLRVLNSVGSDLAITPRTFAIHRGLTASPAPLSHSVGIVVEDEVSGNRVVEWLIHKGNALPATFTFPFRTTRTLDPNGAPEVITIHLVEGESRRPDRNRQVGRLPITSRDVARFIPLGSPLEVSVTISQSRTLGARVFLPSTDQWFDIETQMGSEEVTPSDLTVELLNQQRRLEDALPLLEIDEVVELRKKVEDLAHQVTAASNGDAGTAQQALMSLKELQGSLDTIDERGDLPRSIESARTELASASSVIVAHGSESHVRRLQALADDLTGAIESKDINQVEAVSRHIGRLQFEVLSSHSWFWKEWFEHLRSTQIRWSNKESAEALFRDGERAIQQGDASDLSRITLRLVALAPDDDRSFRDVGIRRG
ncbi:MAG: Hsp70 family protein [Dehalococcoidia bacterium]|nr:MAG: Hsp70 family protein [Dehalococcoidia bacterium]